MKKIKCDELKDEEGLAAETKRRHFEEELKFEQEKFERRLEHEKAIAENRKTTASATAAAKSTNTKLPKLVISKFNGKHTDWLRFWNQFSAEIDASEAAKVTKFSYLKELVEPKVRSCIDGLPFTSEGYERAKNILKTKYGKSSEVINAYVQSILGLPSVQGSKSAKVHLFYETLLISVQALETLGKLKGHLILGASEYARIKTTTKLRVGQPGEPVAELTKFGWTLLSPGTEDEQTELRLTRSSVEDYRRLCELDVLGLEDQAIGDQTTYQDFKDQLSQSPEGWYETGLLWKPNSDCLPSNKAGSLARLNKLIQRLEKKPELFQQYREIIKEQEDQGIIEKATQEPKGKKFYLPHKPVMKKQQRAQRYG